MKKKDFFLVLWGMVRFIGVTDLDANSYAIHQAVKAAYKDCRKRHIKLDFEITAFRLLAHEFYQAGSNYGLVYYKSLAASNRIELQLGSSRKAAQEYVLAIAPKINLKTWTKVANTFHTAFKKAWRESQGKVII